MSDNGLLRLGVIGAAIAALCCFTPVLVILAGVLGLSWLVGYLDFVLFPALFFFIGLTIYAYHRRQKSLVRAASVAEAVGPE